MTPSPTFARPRARKSLRDKAGLGMDKVSDKANGKGLSPGGFPPERGNPGTNPGAGLGAASEGFDSRSDQIAELDPDVADVLAILDGLADWRERWHGIRAADAGRYRRAAETVRRLAGAWTDAQRNGQRGGLARAAKYTAEERSQIARRSWDTRRAKLDAERAA